ncbi:MAG: hypothetical protein K0B81_02070 [Candidatus Cloacimonetes bacterium]|nr:hypothetical protein [Candidatus Cloacimonadota bacterium]
MKNKRWLFILLGILFLINISFLVIVRFVRYEAWIINKLTSMVEKELGATSSIGTLSLTDRQLHLSNISIEDPNEVFRVEVANIYVNYNLLKVLVSNIKISKAVESISIIEPVISVRIPTSETVLQAEEQQKAFSLPILPDISDYFRILTLFNGTLNIEYKDDFITYYDTFPRFDLQVENNRTSNYNLKLYHEAALYDKKDNERENEISTATIDINLETIKGQISSFEFVVSNYQPTELISHYLSELSLQVDLQGQYKDGTLKLNGSITDLEAVYEGRILLAEDIIFFANEERLFLNTDSLLLDGNSALLHIEVMNIFSQPEINLSLNSEKVTLDNYLPVVNGTADIELKITGSISQPIGLLLLESKQIELYSEKVKDIILTGEYFDKQLNISLDQAIWQNNNLEGKGSFSSDLGLNFNLQKERLAVNLYDYSFVADINTAINYQEGITINSSLSNLNIENGFLSLSGMEMDFNLINNDFTSTLKGQRLNISTQGNIAEKEFSSTLNLHGINLNETVKKRTSLLKSYPNLTGRLELSYENKVLKGETAIRMYNLRYGELQGNFRSDVYLDFLKKSSSFSFETINTTYHYEPFSIIISGSGSLDSLKTDKFLLNKDLNTDLIITAKPDLNVTANVSGNNVELSRYLRYFFKPSIANQIKGELDIEIDIAYPNHITGSFNGNNLSYRKLGPFKNDFSFSLANSDINNTLETPLSIDYDGTIRSIGNDPLLVLTGHTLFNSDLDTDIDVYINDLSANNLMPDSNLTGLINADLHYIRRERSNVIDVELTATEFRYIWSPVNGRLNGNSADFAVDTLQLNVRQTDNILSTNKFSAQKEDLFEMSIKGVLGYNIITNRVFDTDDELRVDFSGDLLRVLANTFNFLESGRSETDLELQLGIRQEELSVTTGNFVINRGNLKVKNQPERAEDINLDLQFDNNRMTINLFEAQIGEGRIFIRNEIRENGDDFQLGFLNLGHFYATTTPNGVSIHLPRYLPHGSTGNVVVRGRDSSEAEIRGPFDDIKITADLHISHTYVTYPPDTENLFKLINIATERRPDRTPTPIPLELDLMLVANNQVRYVTYPLNLLVNTNSYLHLVYEDETWIPANAFLSADSGSLDMFGTSFSLDFAQFLINYDLDDYRLNGIFYKYASDGSLITLEIFNETNGSSSDILDTMQFNLKSDNPEDTTILHVLSKLRYNQRLEDIPRSEQNALMQDEFLQLAGIGLSGAFVDPFIYPFINRTRQLFKLDYFAIRPSLVENLIRAYGFTDRTREPEEENEVIQFGKNIILNNLSITMGKLVARDLFIDYEMLLQKPVDVVGRRDLLLYHNFTFHYNLPYRLRLAYRFYLKPEGEKNSHEIFVRRGFSFW